MGTLEAINSSDTMSSEEDSQASQTMETGFEQQADPSLTVKQTDTRAEIERTRDKLENILSPESESEEDTLADAVSDISSIEDETLVGDKCRDNFSNEVSDISSEDLNNEVYL